MIKIELNQEIISDEQAEQFAKVFREHIERHKVKMTAGDKLKIKFYSNGNTMVLDAVGQQVTELQKSWFKFYLAYLEQCGYDPRECTFEGPSGHRFEPFQNKHGWNWEVV